jgi:hypothetical protein
MRDGLRWFYSTCDRRGSEMVLLEHVIGEGLRWFYFLWVCTLFLTTLFGVPFSLRAPGAATQD